MPMLAETVSRCSPMSIGAVIRSSGQRRKGSFTLSGERPVRSGGPARKPIAYGVQGRTPRSGGSITARSGGEGQGASFSVTLPRAAAIAA